VGDELCRRFFNNWGPPHMDLSEYGKWADLLVQILDEAGATQADLRMTLRENSLRVYNVKPQAGSLRQ
jgi:hypothetical protein